MAQTENEKAKMTKEEQAMVLLFELRMVALYRFLVTDGPLHKLEQLLDASMSEGGKRRKDRLERAALYSEFVAEVYEKGGALGPYLEKEVLAADNPYVRMLAEGKTPPGQMNAAFKREMDLFTRLGVLTAGEIIEMAGLPKTMSTFDVVPRNMIVSVPEYLKGAKKNGYGCWAQHGMFRVNIEGGIEPVTCPDPITPRKLLGYEAEKKAVYENVSAMLDGKPAANMLLLGDAGLGKSATVKAVCNELRSQGVRLLEIKKQQLPLLPKVMDQLQQVPLKFVVFMDDLSVEASVEQTTLESLLEGSAAAKPANVIFAATLNQNRKGHRTFGTRDDDGLARWEENEETPLTSRFGLKVLFRRPDRKTYLEIVHGLMAQEGLFVPETDEEIDAMAEAYAAERGGRSPRAAHQFLDQLKRR